MEPEKVRQYFDHVILGGHQMLETPLTRAFLHPDNVQHIIDEISKRITRFAGYRITVGITQQFIAVMLDVALFRQEHAYRPELGLPILNHYVIQHEVNLLMTTLRNEMRYEQQIMEDNRMKVFPYGIPTKIANTRGELCISHSGYQLAHPFGAHFRDYIHKAGLHK